MESAFRYRRDQAVTVDNIGIRIGAGVGKIGYSRISSILYLVSTFWGREPAYDTR